MNATPSGCKEIHSWSLLYLIWVGPDAEYVNGSSALLNKFFAVVELHLRNNFKVLRGTVATLEERDRAVRSANIVACGVLGFFAFPSSRCCYSVELLKRRIYK